MMAAGRKRIQVLSGRPEFNFEIGRESELVDMFFDGINEIRLVGPELVLGKLFDAVGFGAIPDDLFRHLVLARLCYPASKLKTADYLLRYKGIWIEPDSIYRYMDKLHSKQKERIQQISYDHTLRVLGGAVQVVFYDVTTLYFEADEGDELRRAGFSKEGRHQHPQILLGLLVSEGGYPLAYDIFEGNKYEGHTMMPVIDAFREKHGLQKLVVVADAGLLSTDNVLQLEEKGYEYILGARIKNEKWAVQDRVLAIKWENGMSAEVEHGTESRLVVSYSDARAKKDAFNRKKGLEKLEKAVVSGKLSKKNINNRGYNKYLKLEGEITVAIDRDKLLADAKWDGLKGYVTNTTLDKEAVIGQYRNLWKIEKAFRISKTDLRIRPIYHRLKHRIEAHICIAFCAYKIYKELERQLAKKNSDWSPETAIEIANTIFSISITLPFSKTIEKRILPQTREQKLLLELFGS
jgi:transposase